MVRNFLLAASGLAIVLGATAASANPWSDNLGTSMYQEHRPLPNAQANGQQGQLSEGRSAYEAPLFSFFGASPNQAAPAEDQNRDFVHGRDVR
jgi:hypothetical protein